MTGPNHGLQGFTVSRDQLAHQQKRNVLISKHPDLSPAASQRDLQSEGASCLKESKLANVLAREEMTLLDRSGVSTPDHEGRSRDREGLGRRAFSSGGPTTSVIGQRDFTRMASLP